MSGERFRKATPEDYRFHFSAFFLGGVFMIVAGIFGRHFLDHASGMMIWVCATVVISVLAGCVFLWARFVPATVSLILAIITWGAFVWLALRETHVL